MILRSLASARSSTRRGASRASSTRCVSRQSAPDSTSGIGFISAPEPDGSAEIGYGLAESAQGRGYATEALDAVAAWASDQGLGVLVALTAADNLASQRVLERTGFVRGELVEVDDGPMIRWERRLRP